MNTIDCLFVVCVCVCLIVCVLISTDIIREVVQFQLGIDVHVPCVHCLQLLVMQFLHNLYFH